MPGFQLPSTRFTSGPATENWAPALQSCDAKIDAGGLIVKITDGAASAGEQKAQQTGELEPTTRNVSVVFSPISTLVVL